MRGYPLPRIRNENLRRRVGFGHALLVQTQSLLFEEPIDLLHKSVEFGSVLLSGGLFAEFQPAFFGVALHGLTSKLPEGLANLQNIMTDAALRLFFFFRLRRGKGLRFFLLCLAGAQRRVPPTLPP